MVMETYYRKRPKKSNHQSNLGCQKQGDQVLIAGAEPPPPVSGRLPPPPVSGRLPPPPHPSDHRSLLIKGPDDDDDDDDDDGEKKNHIIAGFLYEIDPKHLPPRTPVQLRSMRVAMVCEKTEMNVAVRFPSKESVKAFFNYSTRKTHPALDEKFVMGIALANKVLVNLVTAQTFSEEKTSESFWLIDPSAAEYLHKDNYNSSVTLHNKGAGSCLSDSLKLNGMVRWGVRRQVKYMGRHKEIDGCDVVNGQISLPSLMDGIEKSHLQLVACEDEEKNGDDDIGEEKQNDDDIDEEEEKDDDEEEGDGEKLEDDEKEIKDDDEEKAVDEEEEEEEEKVKIIKRGSNSDLKRKRYHFRNISVKKPKREIIVQIKKQKNIEKPGIKKKEGRARFNKEAIILRNPKDRWSAKRYKMAEENLLSVMISNEATAKKPILRPQLRAEARKKIGDTRLLDHLLKHMAGKVAPESDKRFRRRHNPDGATEYWLENADLVNIRKEAGEKLEQARNEEPNQPPHEKPKVTMFTSYGDKNYSSNSAYVAIAMPPEKLEHKKNSKQALLGPTTVTSIGSNSNQSVQVEIPTPPSINSFTPPHELLVKPLAEKRTVKVTMATNYNHEGDAKNYSSNSASALINLNNAAMPLEKLEKSTIRNEEPNHLSVQVDLPHPAPLVNSSTAALAKPPHQLVKQKVTMSTDKNYSSNSAYVAMPPSKGEYGTTTLAISHDSKVFTSCDGRTTLHTREIYSGNAKKVMELGKFVFLIAGSVSACSTVFSSMERFFKEKVEGGIECSYREIIEHGVGQVNKRWRDFVFDGQIAIYDSSGKDPVMTEINNDGSVIITDQVDAMVDVKGCGKVFVHAMGSGGEFAKEILKNELKKVNLNEMKDEEITDLLTFCIVFTAVKEKNCTGGWIREAISSRSGTNIQTRGHLVDLFSKFLEKISRLDRSFVNTSFLYVSTGLDFHADTMKKRNQLEITKGVKKVHILGEKNKIGFVVWLVHTNPDFLISPQTSINTPDDDLAAPLIDPPPRVAHPPPVAIIDPPVAFIDTPGLIPIWEMEEFADAPALKLPPIDIPSKIQIGKYIVLSQENLKFLGDNFFSEMDGKRIT